VHRKRARFIAVLALVLSPLGLAAQEEDAPAAPAMPPEAEELIVELQQVQMELEPIQQQALSDPDLQAAGEALAAVVQDAMEDVDPSTPERMDRLQTLMTEAEAAQTDQDEARMREIVTEARQIEQQLQTVQAQAVQRPEIAARVEEFQDRLQAKMIEVDPEAEPLMERARELNERLAALLASQG